LATENRNDAQVEWGLRVASPRLPFGRVMLDGRLVNRYLRYLNRERFALGGDTRPRGYAPAEFRGQDAVAATFEVRSRPLDVLTIQVGLAAFADVGAAADEWDEMSLKPSVGIGLRTLIPQANRFVFRVDWGLPLAPAPGQSVFPGGFFAAFGQAFDMPAIKPRTATNAVLD
jgi:outer membrane protein assembly factor BamA